MLTRRNLLTGLGAVLITAPAIVHAGNIMRVRSFNLLFPVVQVMKGKFYFEFVYDTGAMAFVPLGKVGQPELIFVRHTKHLARGRND